jgi:hypothetical protein
MEEAIRLLGDAEDLLNPGVGAAYVDEGIGKLREAAVPASTAREPPW